MRHFVFACLLLAATVPALALDAPPLPATAKKLTRDEIIALMDGKTFKYTSYNHEQIKTGKTRFDFKAMTYEGTYTDKGRTKSFKGEPLSMNNDGYCYDKTCPEGQGAGGVYRDGSTIYEVTNAGTVGEILTR